MRNHPVLPSMLVLAVVSVGCGGGDDDDDSGGGEPLVEVELPGCLIDDECPYVFGCGHRGTTMFAPENTIVGFEMALGMGMEVVEVDVRPTADEVLVLMHDSTVDRTTDGTGEVDEMTLAEIRELWVMSEFDDIDDQPVPTFAEFLAEFDGRALVNVDAKTSRFDLIAADIGDAGMQAWCFVQADGVDEITEMRAADPSIPIMPDVESFDDVELVAPFEPELVELPWQLVEHEVVDAAREMGAKPTGDSLGPADAAAIVHEENGDDPCVAFEPLLELGVALIQTDAPHLLTPCLEAHNATLGYVRPTP